MHSFKKNEWLLAIGHFSFPNQHNAKILNYNFYHILMPNELHRQKQKPQEET
jgi:hypothetical protein